MVCVGIGLVIGFCCQKPVEKPVRQAQSRPSRNGNQKWFKETTYDGGKVLEGTILKRTFKFRNPHDKTYRIIAIKKGCTCARVAVLYKGKRITDIAPIEPPLEIPPGGEGEIELVLDTTGIDGPLTASADVRTDDPEAKWIYLRLKAESILYFWAEPSEFGLGEMAPYDFKLFDFYLVSGRIKEWKIKRWEAPKEYKIKISKAKAYGNTAYKVTVKVGPGLKPGNYSARLLFFMDYKNFKVSVPVSLSVRPTWETVPSQAIKFGKVKKGRGKSVKITIRNLARIRKFKLKGLRIKDCNRPISYFRVVPRVVERGWKYEVTFTVLGNIPSGAFRGFLLIKTNDADMPQKKLPFHGFVK